MSALRAVLAAALALTACGPPGDAPLRGTWRVDAAGWLADPTLAEAAPAARAALESIARGLVDDLRFTFDGQRCVRRVAGREEVHRCVFEAVDRGVVVLRATAPDGGVHFVRARPEGDRLALEWRGRRLPLARVAPGAGPAEAPK